MKDNFIILLVALGFMILHGVAFNYSEHIEAETQTNLTLNDKVELDEWDEISGEEYYDDDDVDNFGEVDDKARWSYLPRFTEVWCQEKCRLHKKPFARLVGVRCQCLCPINAIALSLCPPSGGYTSCFDFCKMIGYPRGGACLYNENCFCFCGKQQAYNASIVYATTPTPSIWG